MSVRLAVLLAPLCLPAWSASYHFAAIWDGEKVWRDACIAVEGDRIQSVGPCAGAAVDLTRFTAIPGLIDVHTHMTYVLGNNVTRAARAAATVFLAQDNPRKTLEAGVTTVRDLGASGYADIAMRDLIAAGKLTGPRMFVAGYGLQNTRGTNVTPNTAHGPVEVDKVARAQIAAGADWVKMYASTGSGQDVSGTQTYSYEEIKAAVDAAHALGKRIAVHSYGPDAARDAVRAGVDSLEHATDMDDGTIAEIVRRKIVYVPTIDHNRYYADNFQLLRYPPEAVTRLNDYIRRNLETARKAFAAGVTFAMGSDAVYTMFGENTRELGWFVKAGMTPAQALHAGTANGAALLGMEKSL
ncbi:MAG TPA: amidohydrolase family protein, partial [Acetobacteraceae bacterium]|nr:amidohydrolase family protein [Acetobacteraceae bacterium]